MTFLLINKRKTGRKKLINIVSTFISKKNEISIFISQEIIKNLKWDKKVHVYQDDENNNHLMFTDINDEKDEYEKMYSLFKNKAGTCRVSFSAPKNIDLANVKKYPKFSIDKNKLYLNLDIGENTNDN